MLDDGWMMLNDGWMKINWCKEILEKVVRLGDPRLKQTAFLRSFPDVTGLMVEVVGVERSKRQLKHQRRYGSIILNSEEKNVCIHMHIYKYIYVYRCIYI